MVRTILLVALPVLFLPSGGDGQGLPQPPVGMEGRAQLMFPAVLDFLYDGDFDVVPDDPFFRAYLVSTFRGMEQVCGTWDSEKDGPAAAYGVTWLTGGGEDAPEAAIGGFNALLALALATAAAPAPGDSAAPPPTAYMTEGIQDGAALAATFQCNSVEGRTLRSRMLGLFVQESGPPVQTFDPLRCLRLLHPQWRELFQGCGVPSWPSTVEGGATRRSTAGEERLILIQQDDRAFARADSSRALVDVREYLRVFGTWGIHLDEVTAILDSLDTAAFQEARTTGTIPGFQRYLDTFPGGRHEAEARAAILAFDERAFAEARRLRTDSAFTSYLALYPQGMYVAQAGAYLELSAAERAAAAAVAAVGDTLRGVRTRRTLTGVGSLTAFAGAGAMGFLAWRSYGRFGDLEAELARVSPDSLAVFGPLDAEKGATGRRAAFQAAASVAVVAVALKLRSAWQGYSEASERSRAALTAARDSLSAIEGRIDDLLAPTAPVADPPSWSLSLHPLVDPSRSPALVVRVHVPLGGGGSRSGYSGHR